MGLFRQRPLIVLSMFILAFSIAFRYLFIGAKNLDVLIFEEWYDHLATNGWKGLASEHFSNYPPAYLYLLWVFTYLGKAVDRLPALKLFPTLFDVFSMYIIFRIARLYHLKDDFPYLFASLFFALPTILINSSVWGQVDSCFTAFLLLCIYLLMIDKPFWAMMAFGVAFSFKLQAIFLLPFLVILTLKGKILWYYFLLVPIIYVAFAIPIALTGRSWRSLLSIYIEQVPQFQQLSSSAPNLYIFVPNKYYEIGLWVGLAIFGISMAAWGWVTLRAKIAITHRNFIFLALTSLALAVFLLPLMHDRYFYPVDVFSFVMVIFFPELWFIPVLYQISSGLSYTVFLLGKPVELVMIGAVLNTFVILYILRKQRKLLYEGSGL